MSATRYPRSTDIPGETPIAPNTYTGLVSCVAGIMGVPMPLASMIALEPSTLRDALGLPDATTNEMETGTVTDLRSMSPANVKSAIEQLAPVFDSVDGGQANTVFTDLRILTGGNA